VSLTGKKRSVNKMPLRGPFWGLEAMTKTTMADAIFL